MHPLDSAHCRPSHLGVVPFWGETATAACHTCPVATSRGWLATLPLAKSPSRDNARLTNGVRSAVPGLRAPERGVVSSAHAQSLNIGRLRVKAKAFTTSPLRGSSQ